MTKLAKGLGCIILALAGSRVAAGQTPCTELVSLRLDHTAITSSSLVAADIYKGPPGPATFVDGPQVLVPAHCEVRGKIQPTRDSDIRFTVWLPVSGWNGNYRQEGNSGWAGVIPISNLIDPLRRGFATAATDNGHDDSVSGSGGAKWAIGHPEKVIDFGWRGVHETSVAAKAIIAAFYGRPVRLSYFAGCSEGGREALMEAQRFPEDFQGILAADPSNAFTSLMTSFAWNQRALRDTPASAIPISKLAVIQSAVLKACDTQDSARDGLLDDPRRCSFDPQTLACKDADGSDCLTAPQVVALRRLYSGPSNPRTGQRIFHGYAPGTEGVPRTWNTWINPEKPEAAIQAPHVVNFFGHLVFETDSWDLGSLDFDRDVILAQAKLGPILDAVNPDLRSFRAAGGKLLHYHGWADVAISAAASAEYFDAVSGFLARFPDPQSTSSRVDDFYRLFLVPGMGHCGGGIGPVGFGNVGLGRPGTIKDPQRDVFSALENWVEGGIAPERLIGVGPNPLATTETLARPICAYPAVARYRGDGDVGDEKSFQCASEPGITR